ncbi:transposase [Hassallia byssoidea VB512170]|uniref:Transposase n=2 Tax=Hassallia TaxID=482629 RepID=A0A846H856_9CYAN|nr:transposase [Hassalia byssoidea VB512170]
MGQPKGRNRYHVLGTQPHFLTCTVVNWMPLFGKVEFAEIIFNSLNFLQRQQRLKLYGYVIMENHLHLIASAASLSKEVGDFKSFTARCIIDLLKKNNFSYILNQFEFYKLKHKTKQEYQVWQEGFHPQAILDEEIFKQKLDYIHNNPVKRGYIDDPAHWRYSSYRNYMGQPGLLEVELIDLGETEPHRRHCQPESGNELR